MRPLRNRLLALLMITAGLAGTVRAAEIEFARAPGVSAKDGKHVVAFAVSAPTDVEVAALDAKGKVVRHLAAGLLGGKTPPPPPLKPGLDQELEWDGNDDYGKKADGGPFKVRVRLGVRADFEKAVSIKVFKHKSMRYGVGGLDSSGDLIAMDHPIWTNGKKNHSPDPNKFRYYAGTTRIDMAVSDQTDEILLQCWGGWSGMVPIARFDGLTGKYIGTLPKTGWNKMRRFSKGEPVMDWHGKYFLHDGYGWVLVRFTLDGKPLPFAGGGNETSLPKRFRRHVHQRGMAVGPKGNIYIGEISPNSNRQDPDFQYNFVRKMDANAKTVKEGLVRIYGAINQGVNLDPKGNIFVGVNVKLAGKPVPDEIAGKLKGDLKDRTSQACWAEALYGSIVKFGPEGGSIAPDKDGNMESKGGNNGKKLKLAGKGMKWIHYGASFQSTHNGHNNQHCFCFTPRFDVDHFGRVLFPNPFQNEFKALDNGGNLLFRVHNRDIAGKVKVGCGTTVQATDRGIYVADHPNNQILIFRWKAGAEALVDLK